MRTAASASAALCLPLLLGSVPTPVAAQDAPVEPAAIAQRTEQRPLLEAGVFGGGGWIPDYPAAGQNHVRGAAAPFLIYRGELLRSDDRGLRGRFYRNGDLEFSLNFNGSLPARSRDNRAREGMPNLDYLGEVGPALRYVAWRAPAQRVALELPVRAVFSTTLEQTHFRGFTLSPEVAYERFGLFFRGSRMRLGLGPVFATGRFADYFYSVQGQYARPGRPGYDASGGYVGTRLQFSYRVPVWDRVSVAGGGRVENFSGAENADSPLFKRDWNFTLVAGVAIALYRTEATVASAAEPFD